MKRDLGLVRDILLAVEGRPAAEWGSRLHISEVDDELVSDHIELLVEARLLEGHKSSDAKGWGRAN